MLFVLLITVQTYLIAQEVSKEGTLELKDAFHI